MDVLDLFEDKPSFNAQEELEKINRELEENNLKCENLKEEIEKLKLKNIKLEETQEAIKKNFQSLMDVARNELSEKDEKILTLRREKDDLAFRRKDINSNEHNPELIMLNKMSRGSQTLTLEELTGNPTLAIGYHKRENVAPPSISSTEKIHENLKPEKGVNHNSQANNILEERSAPVNLTKTELNIDKGHTKDDNSQENKSILREYLKRSREQSIDQPYKRIRIQEQPPQNFREDETKFPMDTIPAFVIESKISIEERIPSSATSDKNDLPKKGQDKTSSAVSTFVNTSNLEFNPLAMEEEHTNPFPQSPEPSISKNPLYIPVHNAKETPSTSPKETKSPSITTIDIIPPSNVVPEQQPPVRSEKRTEPHLTTFEGSLKLVNKGDMFVKIKSNRTASNMDETAVTTPQDGVNSSSSSHELHLQISDNCSSSSPQMNEVNVDSPHPENTVANESNDKPEEPPSTSCLIVNPIAEEDHRLAVVPPVPKPENLHPHNNPIVSIYPMMTVPQSARNIEKVIPAPKEPSPVPKVVKPPPPKPKLNFIYPDQEKESTLTESNLQEHDLLMKQNEITELGQEFLQLLDRDDPLLLMAMERAQEKRERLEQKLNLADLGATSTIAPSHLNAELAAIIRKKSIEDKVPTKSAKAAAKGASKPTEPDPESPRNSKENSKSGEVESMVKGEPQEEKCVLLGNSQYNISKDAEGTTVIHLKRFKKKAK